MTEHAHGYVELWWGGKPAFELVIGWPGEAETRKSVEAFACNDFSRNYSFRECYAANLQTHQSRCDGLKYEVHLFNAPGRGRYKVSVLEPPTAWFGVLMASSETAVR